MRRAVLLLMLLPFLPAIGQQAPPASAQVRQQGRLSGKVADPTDAVIPGATVTIHSAHNGAARTATTDEVGRFQFQGLAPGQYTIDVGRDGFAPFHGKFAVTPEKLSVNLDARLKIATDQQQVDVDTNTDTLDPNNNPDGITLNQQQIDALPDDPTLLSQVLEGLSGSTQSQVYVDGFSGGSIPPKNMIREIRINQNSYSAKNDTDPIQGMIEILTKPGTDTLHGFLSASGNQSALNAKNPFYPNQPEYDSYSFFGNLSGPLTKKTSYFLSGDQFNSHTNGTVAAEILDANLNQVPFSQAVPTKTISFFYNPRIDLQVSKNDTLSFRYQISRFIDDNGGISGFSLASQGFNSESLNQTLQIVNSQTIGAKFVNDTHFQYMRERSTQNPFTPTGVTIAVQGAFTDGGSLSGRSHNNQDLYEFQDYASFAARKHYLNFGLRLRSARDANNSSANYNGEYTFPTLDAYQIDRQILQANPGSDPKDLDSTIRAAGGGANLFTITTGSSSVAASMTDVGLFYEDDWRLKPNFTLSYGVRYELQNHIPDHTDVAPRLGFAWSFGPKKSPFTLTAGNGLFYHRFAVSSIMNAERLNGTRQQQYVLLNPPYYPDIPDISTLSAQVSSSTYRINPNYHAEDVYVASINLAHRVLKTGNFSLNYWYARGIHDPVLRNVNAPLPGTYDPADPTSGVRPFGGNNNIYSYDSAGLSRYYRLMPNFTYNSPKGLFLLAHYELVWYTTDSSNPAGGIGFAANGYNLGLDKGPGWLDIRHRVVVTGVIPLPWKFRVSGQFTANTAPPFNIVLGQDLNGDSEFNDRPAFATDLSRPSVVATKWGTFDTDPLPTQKIIPYNYGRAPGSVVTYLQFGRTFSFGPERPHPPSAKGPLPRKYSLTFQAVSSNFLNHPNLSAPIGTLGSPLFGRSVNSLGSRTLNFQSSINF